MSGYVTDRLLRIPRILNVFAGADKNLFGNCKVIFLRFQNHQGIATFDLLKALCCRKVSFLESIYPSVSITEHLSAQYKNLTLVNIKRLGHCGQK